MKLPSTILPVIQPFLSLLLSLPFPLLLLTLASLPLASAQLDKYAKLAGLSYFGTAVDNPRLSNEQYMSVLQGSGEFGSLTPINAQKWKNIEEVQGVFTWTEADAVANTAKAGVGGTKTLRCHTMVWYKGLPSWVETTYSRADMEKILTAHIQNLAWHFKGRCYAWDVVNEAIDDNGVFRQSPMYKAMGLDFITFSFNTAAKADPSAKLYYNDYALESPSLSPGPKISITLAMLRTVKAQGGTIHGVGFQSHLKVGLVPSRAEIVSTMQQFLEAVDEVAITELDIRHSPLKLPSTRAMWDAQARDYGEVVGACLEVNKGYGGGRKCVGVTVWDFTDKYSWVPSEIPTEGEACMWDNNYVKKPAYWTVLNLFKAYAAGGSRRRAGMDGVDGGNGTLSEWASEAAAHRGPEALPGIGREEGTKTVVATTLATVRRVRPTARPKE
ncbi:glycoside hydrolase superfamily [Neurospora tetraspora]|uniref:Beta-xylanase n=1 Tax=Neurospora tetraspora TaxID=94610 RepID=A0AAE0JBS8_9PEZI|nr:glycoside hydrolase superfamily [Neurospora tetraspora]